MMRRMAHAPVAHPIGGAVPTHWSHVGTTPTLFPGALRHKPRGGDPWRSSTAITVICAVPIPRQRPRSAMLAYDDAFRGHVADRCAAFSRLIASDSASLKRSAVAITLLETRDGSGIAGFLLTRRAKGLRSHGGQWALPGGRCDEGETLVAAVLRELDEEIGLRLRESHVLGLLDDYPTRSGYCITPVVLWAGNNPQLRP